MYSDIITEILNDNDDIVLICEYGSNLYGYNPNRTCTCFVAYINSDSYRDPKIYSDNVEVWFFPITNCLSQKYPLIIYEWAVVQSIVYPVDSCFSFDSEKLFVATMHNAIQTIRTNMDTASTTIKNIIATILERYKTTGVLTHKIDNLVKYDNPSDIINDTFFDNIETDYLTLLEFRKYIGDLLNSKGGNFMFSEYTLKALQYIINLSKGMTPSDEDTMPTPTDDEAIHILDYIAQVFDVSSEEFSSALTYLGVTSICSKDVIVAMHSIINNFYMGDTEENMANLTVLMNAEIENDIVKKAVMNTCVRFILRIGELAKYQDYVDNALNVISDTSIETVSMFRNV